MNKAIGKTDLFPGILWGDGDGIKRKCTVAIVTRLTPGKSGNSIVTNLRIDSADVSPPDGMYRLNVRGRIFKLRREGGEWPMLQL